MPLGVFEHLRALSDIPVVLLQCGYDLVPDHLIPAPPNIGNCIGELKIRDSIIDIVHRDKWILGNDGRPLDAVFHLAHVSGLCATPLSS